MKTRYTFLISIALFIIGYTSEIVAQTTVLNQSSGTIAVQGAAYTNSLNMSWLVNTGVNKPVKITLNSSIETSFDFVDIYNVENNGSESLLFSKTGNNNAVFSTLIPNGKFKVVFRSDASVCYPTWSGFTLDFSVDNDASVSNNLSVTGTSVVTGDSYTLGKMSIGSSTPLSGTDLFRIYGASIPSFSLADGNGYRLQMGIASENSCYAIGAQKGDVVFRTCGTLGSMLFNINTNSGDGTKAIKFGDDKNGVFMGVYNDKSLRLDGKMFANEATINGSLSTSGNVYHAGNVGIGVASPQHKLDVKGTICANEVLVKTIDWADFVFDKNYKLPDLKEVDKYIQENGHLPEIPSTAEVKEKGVNLVEVQAKLLQKVEEMTLYILAQEKKMKEMQARIDKLEQDKY